MSTPTSAPLIMTLNDFRKLSSLVKYTDSDAMELLDAELNRASVVIDEELPKDVVSMNSKVSYIDLETRQESIVTLVFPHDAKIEENRISVLAPIGAALIGLRVGQTIEWPLPNGRQKKIQVTSVIYQPEAQVSS